MCARMSAAAAPSAGSRLNHNSQLATCKRKHRDCPTCARVPCLSWFRNVTECNVSARMSRSKTATIHSGIPVPKTYRMCRKWVPHSVLVELILLWQKWGYVLQPQWRRSSALGVHCRYLSAIIINNIFNHTWYNGLWYLLKLLLHYLYSGVQNIKLSPCRPITRSLGTSE